MSDLMGLLGNAGIDPQMLQQLFAQGQSDPFAQNIPGQELLGMPQQQPMQQPQNPSFADQLAQQEPPPEMMQPQGLPELPEEMGGFGFGQTAPQMTGGQGLGQQDIGLRQQLISQLLPQMMGGQNGFIR